MYKFMTPKKVLNMNQLYNYPMILKYIAIQKFGIGVLNLPSRTGHRIMVIYSVIGLYEKVKRQNEQKDSSPQKGQKINFKQRKLQIPLAR